jgi:hypothetical protein
MFHENWGELMGEDVKFTVEQNLRPDAQGGSALFFHSQLDSLELPDKYTVVMRFKTPVWEVPSHSSQFISYQNITSGCTPHPPSKSQSSPGSGPFTRSAQAPVRSRPTTRAPACGPEPSAAGCSTIPAKSHPGRQAASVCKARRVSPGLSETAATRTTASVEAGVDAATSRMARRSGIFGSATTALIVLNGAPSSSSVYLLEYSMRHTLRSRCSLARAASRPRTNGERSLTVAVKESGERRLTAPSCRVQCEAFLPSDHTTSVRWRPSGRRQRAQSHASV